MSSPRTPPSWHWLWLAPAVALLLSPWLSLGLDRLLGPDASPDTREMFAFPRVFSRTLMLSFAGLALWIATRRGLWRREVFGLGADRAAGFRWAQGFWSALLLGLILLTIQCAVQVRHWDWSLTPGRMLSLFGTALLVGFLEEALFRGLFLRELRERLPLLAAVVVSSAVFASAHFLKPGDLPDGTALSWHSGFDLLRTLPAEWTDRSFLWRHWAVLFVLGTITATLTLGFGNIWAAWGFHAGLIVVQQIAPRITDYDGGPWKEWMPRQLVNGMDCLVLLIFAQSIVFVLLTRSGRSAHGSAPPAA